MAINIMLDAYAMQEKIPSHAGRRTNLKLRTKPFPQCEFQFGVWSPRGIPKIAVILNETRCNSIKMNDKKKEQRYVTPSTIINLQKKNNSNVAAGSYK